MATGDVTALRRLLKELRAEYGPDDERFEEALSLTHRDRYKAKRAPFVRGSLTPVIAEQIRHYAEMFPDMSNRDIGDVFGVDGGRVSEALGSLEV